MLFKNRIVRKARLPCGLDTLSDALADHSGAVRVSTEGNVFSAHVAEFLYQIPVGQRAVDWLEKPRNIDFQRLFILYQNIEYPFDLPLKGLQIGIIALSLDDIPQRIGQVRKAVEMRKRRCLGKLVKVFAQDLIHIDLLEIHVIEIIPAAQVVHRSESP